MVSETCEHHKAVASCPVCLLQQVVRQQETITALDAELAGTESACNMHANINRAVAAALGQKTGETWHNLGEKVDALRAENERLKGALDAISSWRKTAHEYDDDMGYVRRDFDNEEDWDMVEEYARKALEVKP